MNKLRQLLRLHSGGKGTKAIASLLGMSRTAVKKYLSVLKNRAWNPNKH
ncbi:helix-turn-helix domain-containing protein [Prevotella sp. 10(H)]|nr:helix-turn-helix domain-containing protein [Prevotella sp. 10(H)]